MSWKSETSKYRDITVPWLIGSGCDIGCGNDPVLPRAICVDTDRESWDRYTSGEPYPENIHLPTGALSLPFKDASLDWVYSSHLLEDFEDWTPLLREWSRVIKPGGVMVILMPDRWLWKAAVEAGQPPNCAHRHEAIEGELTFHGLTVGLEPLIDQRTKLFPGDYSILYVGRKS